MKHGLPIELDWSYLGALFATLDDDEQVLFFRAMLKEMETWSTAYQGEKQLAHINDKFTQEEKERLSMLGWHEGRDKE